MKKTTDELLNLLNQSNDIKKYLEHQKDNFTDGTLSDYLSQIMTQKSISAGECIRRSGLDRTYCYQIFSGAKQPSRDKLLAICFALQLGDDEVQRLLKAAGYPILYPRIQRDSIILFALKHNYSLPDLNELLSDLELDWIK